MRYLLLQKYEIIKVFKDKDIINIQFSYDMFQNMVSHNIAL